MKTTNGKLALSIPPTRTVQKRIEGGLLTVNHFKELMSLKVLFDSDKFRSGQTVYLPADFSKTYHSYLYKVEGKPDVEYALTEESAVLAFET